MNKNVIIKLVVLFFISMSLNACLGLGLQESSSEDPLGSSHARGWSIFPSHENAESRARANFRNSQAEINYAVAAQIREGKINEVLKVGYFKNTGTKNPIYLEHPDHHEEIKVEPNSHKIIYTKKIPKSIWVKVRKRKRKSNIYPTNKEFRGVKLDYGADIKG